MSSRTCRQCGRTAEPTQNFCGACGTAVPADNAELGDPRLGTLIADKFRVEAVIGQGSMGVVYRANQVTLNKDVAIKVLRKRLLADKLVARRFKQEARAASRLNHPNSIQILDFGQLPDGELFMAMEYVEGVNLAEIFQSEGQIPSHRIARILTQVCSALYEAHSNGVIHRDLKPANILVSSLRSRKDYVKVLDFGIAKILDPEPGTSIPMTRDGFVCGTPAFMSPEQVQGFKLDHRSDIFSLGIVLYQALTGRLPFRAGTPMEMATKIVLEVVTPPSEERPDWEIDERLEEICLRALAKKRDGRYDTALEMMEALEVVRDGALDEVEFDLDGAGEIPLTAREDIEGDGDQAPGSSPAPAPSQAPTIPRHGKTPSPAITPVGEPNKAHLGMAPAKRRSPRMPSSVLATEASSVALRPDGRRTGWLLAGAAAVTGFVLVIGLLSLLGPSKKTPTLDLPPIGPQLGMERVEVPTPAPEVELPSRSDALRDPDEPHKRSKVKRSRKTKKRKKRKGRTRGTGKTKAQVKREVVAANEANEQGKQDRPSRARSLHRAGLRLMGEGDAKGAIAKLSKARSLAPRYAPIYRDLGRLHMRKRDHGTGIRYYKRYVDLAPGASDVDTYRKIIRAYQ